MIKIGSVCPLFFNPLKDEFSRAINYLQRFHSSDRLLMQILCSQGDVPNVSLKNAISGTSTPVSLSEHQFNQHTKLYHFTITNLEDGIYTISVSTIGESEPFSFTSSSCILDETKLIRYSHKDNNSIDSVFWIGDVQQIFEIRYECGFKPSGITFNAEVEQFRNQDQEIISSYSVPYKTMRFSAGNAQGLPWWFGEHLNKILCLSMVNIDGSDYVRSESNAVEMSAVMEDNQMFFISALLEPRYNEVHGIGGEVEVPSSSIGVGLLTSNPKDGDVAVYSSRDGAFVNSDRI